MKVVSIVGARPQFIKAAAVSAYLRIHHEEILVHTGQHYDTEMSDVFFQELGLPLPDRNLAVGSGSHAMQTAAIMTALEDVIIANDPDWVLVYGDTNSTLAGALTAAKLGCRIAHIEAGLRSFNRSMPEEINRIVVDHVSHLLFAPTTQAMENLHNEGLGSLARCVGDVMVDVLFKSLAVARRTTPFDRFQTGEYALVTIHRAGNTDNPERLRAICDAISSLPMPVIFPVHPRTTAAMERHSLILGPHIHLVPPAPYLAMVALERDARVILTDSGGVQKEAFLLRRPCVTLRAETEWVETLEGMWNVLVDVDRDAIVVAACRPDPIPLETQPFGDGQASEKIVDHLEITSHSLA